MAATNAKLEYCEVCAGEKAKYTCPNCEVRTCSLVCVNIHKKELDCDGIRNKIKFIPMKLFTDLDLLSDYRLLEQINREIEIVKRSMDRKKIARTSLPVHLYKLKYAAYKKKVNLLFMPQLFTRHVENTTFLNWKNNWLFWRVEWIFPQAENAKCYMERVLDTTKLSKLVEQVLDPVSSCKGETDIEILNAKLTLSDKLQFYRAAGMCGIKVLLKAERVKKANSRFYDLDITLSLQENFENKTIVEYPTLYVIIKDHSSAFDIIDSDEEIEEEQSDKIRKRKYSNAAVNNTNNDEKNKKQKSVNFFFDDFLESDDEKADKKLEKNQSSSTLDIAPYEDLIKKSE